MSPETKLTTPTSSAKWIKTSSLEAPLKDIIGMLVCVGVDLLAQ
ncbi:MAG TPA: hypothetical protein VG759_30240 [Candidatus Angelobacter sp.]|jgi:hypothetical protein|nr:hypothetical protein [Candidatus Angelobacter sp.]